MEMIRCCTYGTNRRHVQGCSENRKIAELTAEINRTKAQLKKEVERRKEAEELLETCKQECLEVLAGGIAHDFNNLMTVVLGSITLSRMLIDDEHEVQEILDEAEKAVKRARSLISQLLAFARGGDLVKSDLELEQLIKEAAVLALNGSDAEAATVSGGGSVFQVNISASRGPAAAGAPGAEAQHPNRRRILVMDDDKQVLKTVQNMLTLMGHDVVLAADGEEAISIYREALMAGKGFEAVIMDLTIPGGMGGLEAMKHLLVIDPEVKAIVSSGYSGEMVMDDYRKWGFKGKVPKPYTIKELSEVLHDIAG
jgi:CheY-like chemotaxis protein